MTQGLSAQGALACSIDGHPVTEVVVCDKTLDVDKFCYLANTLSYAIGCTIGCMLLSIDEKLPGEKLGNCSLSSHQGTSLS